MSATASRIALGVPAHPGPPPRPVDAATEGTRLLPRRDHGGRFVPRTQFPCCQGCGRTLAESLAGRWFCAYQTCEHYRTDAGAVPGVQAGAVTAQVLAVGRA